MTIGNHHAARTALLTGLLALTLGCWQHQRIVSDPTCAQVPLTRGENRVWLTRPAQDSTATLLGEVVQSRVDSALVNALVIIMTRRDSIQLQTGDDGRFRADLRGDTVVRLDIRRIGYDRAIIPALRVRPESLLRVRMQPVPFDGPCSENYVTVERRPWWRIW